jgi:WhiB family redox-sensing transcriptional regulator
MVTPRNELRLDVEGGHVPLVGALAMRRPSWWSSAACKGHDLKLFFPDPRSNNYDTARAICAGCTVVEDCLAAALERGDQFGMFGGKSPQERKQLLQDRARSLGGTTPPTPTAVDTASLRSHAGGSPVSEGTTPPTPSAAPEAHTYHRMDSEQGDDDHASTSQEPAA